jgi:hypothetical protein
VLLKRFLRWALTIAECSLESLGVYWPRFGVSCVATERPSTKCGRGSFAQAKGNGEEFWSSSRATSEFAARLVSADRPKDDGSHVVIMLRTNGRRWALSQFSVELSQRLNTT